MSDAYDWSRVAHRLREHLNARRLSRGDFAGQTQITVIDLDALLTAKPVPVRVLASIETGADLSFADLRVAAAGEPAQFEVPETAPPELLLGRFAMHRWSFDYADRIVSSDLTLYDCPQTGRRRFVAVQANCGPDGRQHTYKHTGFVWPAARSGITQLVAQDEGVLRVVTLALPVRHESENGQSRVTVNGTVQSVAERDDVGCYPAISPVILESHAAAEDDDVAADWIGSFAVTDPCVALPRPPQVCSIVARLIELGPRVLPVFGAVPRSLSGPRPVEPLVGQGR